MFDAIVIGSGMSGGIAAKELCERGLKVLVLERGGDVGPGQFTDHLQPWQLPNAGMIPEKQLADYPVQSQCYALSSATQQFFVKDTDHPYTTPADQPFSWIRGYHKGGRSIMWGRQTYRLSEMDFAANARDGIGSDWPIRYADIAPWYDHIERFIGVSGSMEGLPQLPDGEFLPPFALNDAELQFKASVESAFPGRNVIPGRCANLSEAREHHIEQGRSPCQSRSLCERGCMFKAYHSSLNTSLPAAERTGNLTMVTDAIVESIIHDPATNRVTGVRVIDRNTKVGTTYEAKVIFSCASTMGTASILLQSVSEAFPRGLANASDMVGRNIMDHLYGLLTIATFDTMPDTYYFGRRPTGFYIPRYRNLDGQDSDFLRGYGFQGGVSRTGGAGAVQGRGGLMGEELKVAARDLGPWRLAFAGFGEVLPNPENRITLHATQKDQWGLPVPHIACRLGENELKLAAAIQADGRAMAEAAGGRVVASLGTPSPLGLGIHEMGTACMGTDSNKSVLNKWNQAHDIPNLFITDGAAMASSGCQNPSLTYMALSARAADHAVQLLQEGAL